MKSILTSGGVVRREATLGGSSRYDPYTVMRENMYDHMKEGVVQLGVELSLCVAEYMFLMCDDRKNMLLFCFIMICRKPDDPVSERLIRVMHHVYTDEIVSNNRLYHQEDRICSSSVHCGVIGSAWEDFANAIRFLHRLAKVLRRKRFPFKHRQLSTMDTGAIKRQLIKKIGDKLRCAKDASEANGFLRERLEPTIGV